MNSEFNFATQVEYWSFSLVTHCNLSLWRNDFTMSQQILFQGHLKPHYWVHLQSNLESIRVFLKKTPKHLLQKVYLILETERRKTHRPHQVNYLEGRNQLVLQTKSLLSNLVVFWKLWAVTGDRHKPHDPSMMSNHGDSPLRRYPRFEKYPWNVPKMVDFSRG